VPDRDEPEGVGDGDILSSGTRSEYRRSSAQRTERDKVAARHDGGDDAAEPSSAMVRLFPARMIKRRSPR